MEADLYLTQHPDATPRLNAALVEAQKMLEPVKKEANNPFFKSKYADLANVLAAITPALNANGIAIAQVPDNDATGVACITHLRHVSGEVLTGRFWLPVVKGDPQGYGSAFTYARRFGAKAIVGLAEEDDDGESHRDPKAKTAADYAKPRAEKASPSKPTAAQLSKLAEAFHGLGVTIPMLEERIGCPFAMATMEQFESLKEYGKEKKALSSETADQMAKRLEQEKAEAGIRLEAETKKAKEAADAIIAANGPPLSKQQQINAVFDPLMKRVKEAATKGEAALIVAEATNNKLLTPLDHKALTRAMMDRCLVLDDKAAEPRRRLQIKDADVTL